MVGFVASGMLRGDHPMVHADRLTIDEPNESHYLLDVRSPQEFAAGHVPGAVNVSVDELRNRLNELPRDLTIVVYCQIGMRGYLATRILLQNNFQVMNLGGGYTTYCAFQSSRAS